MRSARSASALSVYKNNRVAPERLSMFSFFQSKKSDFVERRDSRILWLDLGDLGDLVNPAGPHEQWQDRGLGLLRPILHQNGVLTDLFSTRQCTSWDEVKKHLAGYDMLIMNVRSYTYPSAYRSAKLFKEVNPQGIVLTGGMHATVAPDEMEAVPEFDKICQGPGEDLIADLVKDPAALDRK